VRPRPLALTLFACCLPAPAVAQISVAGVRDLIFGLVPLGVTTTVLPTDPVKSGQWTLTAVTGNQVQIRLTVPNQLLGPSGATMPISFQNADAFVQGTWTGAVPNFFNPGGNQVFKFSSGAQAIIRLGGRVTPAANQRPGAYANTVVCTINLLN
jgi:hypothetical protein